jgi:hypothetical protein
MSFPFDLHSATVSDSHLPCSDHAVLLKATAQHSTAVERRLCCGLEKNGMVGAWHGHGMASVNQTRPHCINQMGKTHSKPLAARHGRGTAWARQWHCMLCVNRPLLFLVSCGSEATLPQASTKDDGPLETYPSAFWDEI